MVPLNPEPLPRAWWSPSADAVPQVRGSVRVTLAAVFSGHAIDVAGQRFAGGVIGHGDMVPGVQGNGSE